MTKISGISANEGVALAKAYIHNSIDFTQFSLKNVGDVDEEIARLEIAKDSCEADLDELIEQTRRRLGDSEALILSGQKGFLSDPSFYPLIVEMIREKSCQAEFALWSVLQDILTLFNAIEDEYMKERAADLNALAKRLLRHLLGGEETLKNIKSEVILIAEDLTPGEAALLDRRYVMGIALKKGSSTSHAAILARSLGIPAVLGLGDALGNIKDSSELIIDAAKGLIIANADPALRLEYEQKALEQSRNKAALAHFKSLPATLANGDLIRLGANIASAMEASLAKAAGAAEVGLFRSEFLFMQKDQMPSEEEQFAAYKEAALAGLPLVLRTLDIGGDKGLSYINPIPEDNPFLGYRAIRICLDKPQIFLPQLRAILRAGVFGQVKIMLPMVSGLEEVAEAKRHIEEAKASLRAQNIPFDENMQIGLMVEIPSLALVADAAIAKVDFFSIGTNDLVQYALAADRMNEKVAALNDYFHPGVLRLIKMSIDASKRAGKWTGMCGVMASDTLATPLLIGLGLDEFSVDIAALNSIKETLSKLDRKACSLLAARCLELGDARSVRAELKLFAGIS